MFYLFSSDYAPRYKIDILDILCYPEGHIFRFRYQEKYVSPEIKSWTFTPSRSKNLNRKDRKGLVVYAETNKESGTSFKFYPIREIEIIRIQVIGSVYYIDIRLKKFVNYYFRCRERANEQLEKMQKSVESIEQHPKPKQGYFFNYVPRAVGSIEYSIDSLSDDSNEAWESVVEILSKSPSMRSCIFYLIKGFFSVKRQFWLIGEYKEKLIWPDDDNWDTKYKLPMGEPVILKLLFYRSEEGESVLSHKFEIKAEGEGFAGVSEKEIEIRNRYNEERVLIACRRVFDSTLSPLSIKHQTDALETSLSRQRFSIPSPISLNIKASPKSSGGQQVVAIVSPLSAEYGEIETIVEEKKEVLAPNPFLLTHVVVPKHSLVIILIGLILAPILLTLSPDLLRHIGASAVTNSISPSFGGWLERNAGDLSILAKGIAASLTLVAGYLGLRKFPVGK